MNESKCLEKANKFNLNTVFKSFKSLEIRQKWSTENKLLTVLKNFAQNVFKWHYFDQVYSRFTSDGKMAFFTSQTRGAYHLTENVGNSGWKVNGKVTFRKFQPKI